MLDETEFEKIIHDFFGELQATFEGQSSRPLIPEVADSLENLLCDITNVDLSPEEKVALAFAIVNQYVESTWADRISEGYALYIDTRMNH